MLHNPKTVTIHDFETVFNFQMKTSFHKELFHLSIYSCKLYCVNQEENQNDVSSVQLETEINVHSYRDILIVF